MKNTCERIMHEHNRALPRPKARPRARTVDFRTRYLNRLNLQRDQAGRQEYTHREYTSRIHIQCKTSNQSLCTVLGRKSGQERGEWTKRFCVKDPPQLIRIGRQLNHSIDLLSQFFLSVHFATCMARCMLAQIVILYNEK